MAQKAHLPGHLDSARQTYRPKHQVVINKCYPRLPKNSTIDAKPNGSELSALCFYMANRPVKLPKVASYLERRTAREVAKQQSAPVLVTLQILSALMQINVVDGSALALIAPYLMRILSLILSRAVDVSLFEASCATWDVFCQHQDMAVLEGKSEYKLLYEQVLRQYASLGSKHTGKRLGSSTSPVEAQTAMRLRRVGLSALLSVLRSETLALESAQVLHDTIVPAVISNLRGDAKSLSRLFARAREGEEEQKSPRASMAANRDEVPADPRAAEGSIKDADDLEEEKAALMAVACLKAIFNTSCKPLLHAGAGATLEVLGRDPDSQAWAVELFAQCAAWTAVQDRFLVVVVAINRVGQLENMRQQYLLLAIIEHIFHSDLNLIGLSIMDVLLGLLSQTARILREGSESNPAMLEMLQKCVAHLATHVYYQEQITDMVSAILTRLKSSDDPSPTPFSTPPGRRVGLEMVASIFRVAHSSPNHSGVPISIFEKTQWMVRDESEAVRQAYADMITTWLRLEAKPSDLMPVRTAVPPPFLAMLHRAHYDHVVQMTQTASGEHECDRAAEVLLTCVRCMGIHAVATGLPMIFSLLKFEGGSSQPLNRLADNYLTTVAEIFQCRSDLTQRALVWDEERQRVLVDGVLDRYTRVMQPSSPTSASSPRPGSRGVAASPAFSPTSTARRISSSTSATEAVAMLRGQISNPWRHVRDKSEVMEIPNGPTNIESTSRLFVDGETSFNKTSTPVAGSKVEGLKRLVAQNNTATGGSDGDVFGPGQIISSASNGRQRDELSLPIMSGRRREKSVVAGGILGDDAIPPY